MKYWFLKLEIQSGEYCMTTSAVHSTPLKEKFDAEAYAKDFWCDGEDTYGNGTYYFNGGEIACSVFTFKEITKKEYDIMRKYL